MCAMCVYVCALLGAGKDVTVKVMKKKPKKGAKPDAKPQMKTEKVESFFNFFDPPQVHACMRVSHCLWATTLVLIIA